MHAKLDVNHRQREIDHLKQKMLMEDMDPFDEESEFDDFDLSEDYEDYYSDEDGLINPFGDPIHEPDEDDIFDR